MRKILLYWSWPGSPMRKYITASIYSQYIIIQWVIGWLQEESLYSRPSQVHLGGNCWIRTCLQTTIFKAIDWLQSISFAVLFIYAKSLAAVSQCIVHTPSIVIQFVHMYHLFFPPLLRICLRSCAYFLVLWSNWALSQVGYVRVALIWLPQRPNFAFTYYLLSPWNHVQT